MRARGGRALSGGACMGCSPMHHAPHGGYAHRTSAPMVHHLAKTLGKTRSVRTTLRTRVRTSSGAQGLEDEELGHQADEFWEDEVCPCEQCQNVAPATPDGWEEGR
jgi:hypothetical protein